MIELPTPLEHPLAGLREEYIKLCQARGNNLSPGEFVVTDVMEEYSISRSGARGMLDELERAGKVVVARVLPSKRKVYRRVV